MLVRFLLVLFFFVNPFLIVNASDGCDVLSFDSTRISDSSVSVQGVISEPRRYISIEVWKHTKLIGTATARSNARGVFLSTVRTDRRSYKRPSIVITCHDVNSYGY